MKLKSFIAAAAFCTMAPAMAASCTQSFSLGNLGPPDFAFFGNSFSQAIDFNDCYSFSLNAEADAIGVAWEWDNSQRFDVDLFTASIFDMSGNLIGSAHDFSSPVFRFDGLGSGEYRLEIAGAVTAEHLRGRPPGSVGYGGVMTTTSAHVASPVPEPEMLAMLALGLGVVVWTNRRTADGKPR